MNAIRKQKRRRIKLLPRDTLPLTEEELDSVEAYNRSFKELGLDEIDILIEQIDMEGVLSDLPSH